MNSGSTNVNLLGWELLFDSIKDEISSESELLLAFIHWHLIKRNAKCLGLGDEKILKEDEKHNAGELLPKDWNRNKENYSLRYIFKEKLHILYVIDCENMVLFNLLNVSENITSSIVINKGSYVKSIVGSTGDIISDYPNLIHKIKINLLANLVTISKQMITSSTQTVGKYHERRNFPDPRSFEFQQFLSCYNDDIYDNEYIFDL